MNPSPHGATDLDLPRRKTWLPYGRQWIDEQDIQAVAEVMRGDYLTTGPHIRLFERKLADYVGARHAVAFANGTAALHAACFAAGIGPGDEVITTPLTFAASANCVLYLQGVPVFADIDERTYNIDPDRAASLVTAKTKAIIAVDFTGQPADLRRLKAIAAARGLVLIEDAAHALGAEYEGRRVGSISDMTMFSLHPVKHITAGEGGVITTDNETYYRKLLQFRSHGITRDSTELADRSQGAWYYEMQSLGFNYRLTDMQAALASSQLDKLDMFVAKRREYASLYQEAFSGDPAVQIPHQEPFAGSSWHLYVIQLRLERLDADRNAIYSELTAANIGVNVHYIPVYRHPYYRRLGYPQGLCPRAEKLYERIISLPLFPAMTPEDVQDVVQAVKYTVGKHRC